VTRGDYQAARVSCPMEFVDKIQQIAILEDIHISSKTITYERKYLTL
jgi:hypothetical protein